MPYPISQDKHFHKALFGPESSLDTKNKPKNLPKNYILIYEDSALEQLKQTHQDLKEIPLSNGLYSLHSLNNIGIVKMNGIGSPHASCVLEDLIHLGGEVFLNLGIAGGLKHQGFFIPNKALRDEGTSYHYIPPGEYSYSDKALTKRFATTLTNQGISFEIAPTWTTDAPYRETQEEIETYREKGIVTVEMETSALFAVAKKRNVQIAAGFVVSDILSKKRETINKDIFTKNLIQLIEAGILCLTSI
jgi:uridine phosphorylase